MTENRGQMTVSGGQMTDIRFQVEAHPQAAEAASLIKNETNEHRTLNVQRPTSNNVFYQ
jgi:hypothetical protein